MNPTCLMGVDIGTQGTKGVLVDVRGRTLATAFVKSRLSRPSPGVVEEDPEVQFRSVCRCIRECVGEAGVGGEQVAAIGIDGQMAGSSAWAATAGTSRLRFLARHALRGRHRADEERSGRRDHSQDGRAAQLQSRPEDPVVEARASGGLPAHRGVRAAGRLCGHAALRAAGCAGFHRHDLPALQRFCDNARGAWDADLCRTFDVAAEKLPRIVEPQAIVGGLSARWAVRCGLKAGAPVVAGCGDTAASFLACGATREGACVDVAGTASVFAATTTQFRADVELGMLGWGRSATRGSGIRMPTSTAAA